MTTFQVDSNAVLDATHAAQTSLARLTSEATALTSHLTSLHGSWSGQAATAFQSVLADWHAAQKQIEEHMTRISTALSSAAQHYAQIESQNHHLFNTL